jgi:hypothetical protein
MAIHSINYSGIIQWKEQSYYNPLVYYNEHLLPYQNDLVVVKKYGLLLVIPYSNQEQILGVVTLLKEPTQTVDLELKLREA